MKPNLHGWIGPRLGPGRRLVGVERHQRIDTRRVAGRQAARDKRNGEHEYHRASEGRGIARGANECATTRGPVEAASPGLLGHNVGIAHDHLAGRHLEDLEPVRGLPKVGRGGLEHGAEHA